jgi:hypothetical protein
MILCVELCRKIRLYNSTVLCDIFRSRLKVNSLMTLFRLQSGRYIRLWHYLSPVYGSNWLENFERKIQYYRSCKGFG